MSVAELDLNDPKRPPGDKPLTLVDYYLRQQQDLSAVEKFSIDHEAGELPLQARYYTALLPAAPPKAGEQYAFDVDLDACSGCKACVTACHSLNGLDDTETWRDVGLLHGGSESQPFMQHVTAACHHCLDPACLNGCPVRAYDKDPQTGIVRHLDDQCIGCQYCIFACPYDVPKYNKARGIVRKCDMCTHRLAVNEAPACVQACPNSAIRITVVSRREVVENCETGVFLPGAPDPHYTQPSTNYRTRRNFPRNVLPADYFSARPEHAHWPLILMLVLTQLSVGAFLVELLLATYFPAGVLARVREVQVAGALAFGLLALGASTLHLGRPMYAFRAIVGLRTSWLSREIVAFGLFAGLAVAYAVAVWQSSPVLTQFRMPLGAAVVLSGLAGVACSIMIYQCTRRVLWNGGATTTRFLGTTVILGLSTTLSGSLIAAAVSPGNAVVDLLSDHGTLIARGLMLATSLKLLFEGAVFLHLRDRLHTPLKRSALLMTKDLARFTLWRFVLGAVGGILFPAMILRADAGATSAGIWAVLSLGSFVSALGGELLERYLFFTAVAAPRMPGGLRS